MSDYHINLPHNLLLTVEVADTPITMHITFPKGKRVSFTYDGKPGRHANTLIGTGPHIGRLPATVQRKDKAAPDLQRVSLNETSQDETIEYIDPAGSEM